MSFGHGYVRIWKLWDTSLELGLAVAGQQFLIDRLSQLTCPAGWRFQRQLLESPVTELAIHTVYFLEEAANRAKDLRGSKVSREGRRVEAYDQGALLSSDQ